MAAFFGNSTQGYILEGTNRSWKASSRSRPTEDDHPECFYFDVINMISLNSALFILGTIGNICIVMVMWKDVKKLITPFLLVNLAISDTLVLTTYWVFQVPKILAENYHIKKLHFFVKYFGYFLQKYQAIVVTFMTTSAWIIVLATFHRYLSVSRPLTANTNQMKRRIRYLVALIWIGSIIYNIPRYFFLDVVYVERRDAYVGKPNKFGNSFGYKFIYNTILYFLTLSIIPLSIMLFSTVNLIKHMRKIAKKRAVLTTKSQQDRDMNKSLVVIVVSFFILTFAVPVNSILRNIVYTRDDFDCPKILFFFGRLNPSLIFMNSSINFFIYVFCSRHFRGSFLTKLGIKRNVVVPVRQSDSGSGSRGRFTLSSILSTSTNQTLTPVS